VHGDEPDAISKHMPVIATCVDFVHFHLDSTVQYVHLCLDLALIQFQFWETKKGPFTRDSHR